MRTVQSIIDRSKKIVLKIGSNVLAGSDGSMDTAVIADIAAQTSDLMRAGKRVIIVSSGAEVSGVRATGMWSRRGDMNYKQAMCAIGQVELMMAYKESFKQNDIVVGQLLLTRSNFGDATSMLHIRNTLFTLLDEGVVPIINENDSVSVDEFTLGDNDKLAALTSNLWNADLLILMSDIDGVFDKSPKDSNDAVLIEEVTDTDRLRRDIEISGTSSYGTGGLESKIAAAEEVGRHGTSMLLVNGKRSGILNDIAKGEGKGTLFIPSMGD